MTSNCSPRRTVTTVTFALVVIVGFAATILLLTLEEGHPRHIHPHQVHHPHQPQHQSHHQLSLPAVAGPRHRLPPTPYSRAWVHDLEWMYNTFGKARNSSLCPVDLPKWACPTTPADDHDNDKDNNDDDNSVKEGGQADNMSRPGTRDPPTSAWKLRPRDIRVVATMGDSISAGFGMLSGRIPFATVLEHRGLVFSDGANKHEFTITNFLKKYHKVVGGPKGVTFPLSQSKELNMAVSGAIAQSLPDQVNRLCEQFGRFGSYHKYRNEWKLITIFIGANNLCEACGETEDEIQEGIASPKKFSRSISKALLQLRDDIGPAFVNLVGLLDVTMVYDLAQNDNYCRMVMDQAFIPICKCACDNDGYRQSASAMAKEYNWRLKKIAADINEDSKEEGIENFAVVYQPALTEFKDVATPYGQGYLSGFDCFHPNKCANQVMAIALWNNMFSKEEDKYRPISPETIGIYCPNEDDYLR